MQRSTALTVMANQLIFKHRVKSGAGAAIPTALVSASRFANPRALILP